MKLQRIALSVAPALLALAFTAASTTSAYAVPVTWTDWTAGTSGTPGSATGTIALGSGISVNYSGQTFGLRMGYPSWTPTATFSGGTVSNAPPAAFNSVGLTGGSPITETVSFSSPLTDPVMAIWSLGQPGLSASFDFTSGEPFTIESGGPSAEFGGSSITKSGNNVFGSEGNGVIQFTGTYSSLTFTTPGFENYYVFTVGADSLGGGSPVPEPETLSLFGLGLLALPVLRRSLRRS